MSQEPVRPDSSPEPGPAGPVLPPRRDVEALSLPGKRYLDRKLTDPAGRGADEVRAIRDDIDRRVRELLGELTTSSAI